MRYGTGINRLRTIADECQRIAGLWDEESVLVGAYAFGDVFDTPPELEVLQLAFALRLTPDEVPWLTQPRGSLGLIDLLRLDKTPVAYYWRSADRPVANHVIDRPVRIWSSDGPDTAVLDALGKRDAESLRLPAPTPAEAREQHAAELQTSLAHLRHVEANYWERDWRRDHRGSGIYPENHLWDATHGYVDLLEAANHLRS